MTATTRRRSVTVPPRTGFEPARGVPASPGLVVTAPGGAPISHQASSSAFLSRPLAVAITGGIGAGKSTALDAFRRHGAATVSSDEIVHHLLRTDPDVKRALVERFGEEILDGDGVPDRERIGFRVFNDRDALDWLE